MICDLCGQPIDGQSFGPEVSDTWCMACWWEMQDAEAEAMMIYKAFMTPPEPEPASC